MSQLINIQSSILQTKDLKKTSSLLKNLILWFCISKQKKDRNMSFAKNYKRKFLMLFVFLRLNIQNKWIINILVPILAL